MTPNDVGILIHYRCSNDDHPRLEAPAVQEACKIFVELGLLKPGTDSFRYSGNLEALSIYVDALCSVPLPTMKWTIDIKQQKEVIKCSDNNLKRKK